MTNTQESLAQLWGTELANQQAILNRVRECCRLVDPSLCPPEGQTAQNKLPENYQSAGWTNFTRVGGKIKNSTYPTDWAWFRHLPHPDIVFARDVNPEAVRILETELALQDAKIGAAMETPAQLRGNRQPSGFHSAMHHMVMQVLVTGHKLERLEDNASNEEDTDREPDRKKNEPISFRSTIFRRDQWGERRDSAGDILWQIIKEKVDALSLKPDKLAKANLDQQELRTKRSSERQCDLFTHVEWHPWSRKWHIRQELVTPGGTDQSGKVLQNGVHLITEGDEVVTPFISTPMRLVSGESYGRGLAEGIFGDLRSLDELAKRILQFAELCTKHHLVLDYAARSREKDWQRGSGISQRADVSNGKVNDVAFMQVNKVGDFTVAKDVYNNLREEVGQAALSGTQGIRDSERTPSIEVAATLKEADEALGGVFTAIGDRDQQPRIARVQYVLEQKNVIKKLPAKARAPVVLTGIAAIANRARFNNARAIGQFATELAQLPPSRLDKDVLLDYATRMLGVHVPGLIMTPREFERRVDAARKKLAEDAAIQQGIETAGKMAETRAQQQGAAA